MNKLKVHEIKVVNTRDVDICVRDASGRMHILFPHAEKIITTITEAAGRRSSGSGEPMQQEK